MKIKELLNNLLPLWLYKLLAKLYRFSKVMLFYFFRTVPVQKNKIVFSSYLGRGFGDNGKYIALELMNRKKNLDLVWLVKDINNSSFPKKIRIVQIDSVRAIYEQSTAAIWIDNCRKPSFVRKRKSQYYIQTWHGSLGIKKCEKDAESELGLTYVNMAKNDSRMIDLCISNGTHISNIYKNSFWYNGNILECGTPRNDILLNIDEHQRNAIKGTLNVTKKICLYAPTFRDTYDVTTYELDYKQLIDCLENKFNAEFVVFVRLHPNFAFHNATWNLPEFVKNVTDFPDMQELLAVSDVLITDYSSSIYEFAYTGRPAFIYAPDLSDYINTNRNLYFKIDETPFGIAETQWDLLKNIENFSEKEYVPKIRSFLEFHGVSEKGNASKSVVDHIMTKMQQR